VQTAGTRTEQSLLQTGGFGKSTNSARAGFLPVALENVPLDALAGIGVYIRVNTPRQGEATEADCFRLYCTENVAFHEVHRRRLIENGVRFVYVRMVDQSRFRQQTEALLSKLAGDGAEAISARASIVYETSIELVNELLAEPDLLVKSPRLEQVSRSISTLVLNNPSAFSHLFAASHHDFYTATHMVNVATWMVPLAFEMGHKDPDELNQVCQAGLLHDMGKTVIPEAVLNKPGKLSDEEWALIKRHPEAGCEYLARFDKISPLIMHVTREHHERMDGSGYPAGL